MKANLDQIKINLAVILGIILIINLFFINGLNNKTEKKIEEIKELRRPVKLELITIKDKNCKDCFDLTPIINSIKNANTDIVKEETKDIKEAKELIDRYDIKKIPTILLFGEIDRIELNDFEETDGVLLFKEQKPLYVDVVSNNIIGRVSIIHIKDSSCAKCVDFGNAIDGLEQSGIVITNRKTIERTSSQGKEMINKYNINKIPTLILSKDISAYESVSLALDRIATTEKDGSYVIREVSPPFINTSTGKTIGLVDLTMLKDNSCIECYDVTIHKSILNRFGVVLDNEKTLDITDEEGKKLIEKYNIKSVPMILLSKDASYYPALVQVWKQVGTIEKDGNFVFREIKAIQSAVYKDLTTNKITK